MPIYEYICSACGAEFEKLVFGSHSVLCPQCQSAEVQKKFSVFGMRGVQKPSAGSSSSGCGSCSKSSCSSCH